MSFVAVAVGVVGEGVAANLLAGAMMGATTTVAGNVIGGRDPFDNIGRGIVMGGLTGGLTPGVAEAFQVGMPAAAGITSFGLNTLATGDLGKGLMAGATAYGLYGLSENMVTAGGNALVSDANLLAAQQATELSGLESMSNAFGEAGANVGADAIGQATTGTATNPNSFDKLSRGFDAAKTNPGAFFKDNAKYLMYAAGPLLADAGIKSNMPTTTTRPGAMRRFSYDPYGQIYTPIGNYEVPVKAAEGGLMGMNDGGYNPGQLDFMQRSEPVVRMAAGGIAHFVLGGEVKGALEAAYAANDVAKINEIASANKITAADIADTYKGFDTSGITGLQLYAPPAAPTYNQFTNEQIGSYLTANPNVDINKAIAETNADPAAVNRYIASLASPFVGSTDTKGGSGTLGIYSDMVAKGVDPTEYYTAALANDPKYGGWSKDMIQKGYNLDKGAYALSAQIEKDKIAADPKLGYDKQWVNFMDTNKYSIDDMAQAFGLSRNEVKARYDAVKNAEKKTTVVGGTGNDIITKGPGSVTSTVLDTNSQTNAPAGTRNPYGNINNPGDLTFNADGTTTVTPNIPGRPYGGFSGMGEVKNAYTQGGGSLGYIPYAPKTIEEFDAKYNKLTGGSKEAYDRLTGKTKYSPTPFTETGEVMKPYAESVLGVPRSLSSKKVLFDPVTKTYKNNPDYIPVSYTAEGKKVYGLSGRDIAAQLPDVATSDYEKWAKDNNVTHAQIAEALGISLAEAKKRYPLKTTDTAITETIADIVGGANGGLMAMAGGGMSSQFNLGGYSDGGRLLRGPGDGVSDSIPATIGNKRPARLADGEFVVPARIVSELGNGSTEAGARKLYAMMDRVQRARRGTVGKGRVAKNSRSEKYLPA